MMWSSALLLGVALAMPSPGASAAGPSRVLRLRANGTVLAEVCIKPFEDLRTSISADRETIAGRTNGFLIRRYIGARFKIALKDGNPIEFAAPEIEAEEPLPAK